MKEFLWVEKYRPHKIDECILPDGSKKSFQGFLTQGEIPNLLLSGPAGVGKTTGEEYTNRAHFDYKWENGKIVELLAYYSEYADLKESAALQATQE